PIVKSNSTKLKQTFSNLISNAFNHHDRENGKIVISALENDENFEFVVKDDGPGIAPQYHEKVFQIFNTLGVNSKKSSTGIGLAIVKKIVNEFEGEIFVESDVGKGASFKFTHRKY
ncbi:MAG: HAMP domain-containing histidine kinase, partial [Nitrospinae bacterium]|nr:HAMP domain-containing histidine kinase [Nitrospinota bacterium]